MPYATRHPNDVTWRAVLIGLVLIPVNSYWVMQMEAVYYSAHSTAFALFFNVVFTVLTATLGALQDRALNMALLTGSAVIFFGCALRIRRLSTPSD